MNLNNLSGLVREEKVPAESRQDKQMSLSHMMILGNNIPVTVWFAIELPNSVASRFHDSNIPLRKDIQVLDCRIWW